MRQGLCQIVEKGFKKIMAHGGKRENAGRKKGSMNEETKEALQLLKETRLPLMKKAISLAMAGNVPILQKLLDKIAPTLTENVNFTFEDWLKKKHEELGDYGI